ncbi:Heterokaryon incompatibility protein 6, OR allele [Lachnellula arida]|uniref:Heterokaryon incompatibility protein 6, OR allele n=1 Tax=Lachnellula arida TaxID=1316785 RepID=A0A8T9BJ55_9HELO|nr:Heterokaryon incompatibility protein 6, OR allele [Lachnellula arida]
MDVAPEPHPVYRPINPYQTRILCLHGDHGGPDSRLVCDVYVADILHPRHEGLGVRSLNGENDRIEEYDALSYTWGSGENADAMVCNGAKLPISNGLFEALRTLRRPEKQVRYLWVDAICINQSDDGEKSKQVWNMLTIYEKAAGVIVWLGPASSDMDNVLVAASSISPHNPPENEFDLSSICTGLTKPLQGKKDKSYIKQTPDEISAQLEAISKLDQLHKYKLNCFEQFSKKNRLQPDFIEALLDTGLLKATNPLDYIYGIIGMIKFPAKAMTIQEWTMARQHEVFIPIDYSANLTSILCAVTWAALMKGGLAVLAKFKAFTSDDDNNACEHPLPSWVIDWRLAGRLFKSSKHYRNDSMLDLNVKIEEAWDSPEDQEQFCQDNRNGIVPYTKLILRGRVIPILRAEGKCIWEKRKSHTDKALWQLECDVYPTDLVVNMLGFIGAGYPWVSPDTRTAGHYYGDRAPNGGLWLLRPAGDNEFKLIACLSYGLNEAFRIYHNWKWNPGYFGEASSQAQLVGHCRRFSTERKGATGSRDLRAEYEYNQTGTEESIQVRNFTII